MSKSFYRHFGVLNLKLLIERWQAESLGPQPAGYRVLLLMRLPDPSAVGNCTTCLARIRYNDFLLHTHGQPQDMEAWLINYSEQGVCLTSRHPLTPGTTIVLRTSGECYYNNLAAGSDCLLRSTALAKVKWRPECTWPDPPAHAMGAAYLIKY